MARLVRHLESIGDVYIHLDRKANISSFEPVRERIIDERIDVCWAGWSMIEATMQLLRNATSSSNCYRKYVLLSGQDYPIKPMAVIKEALLKSDENILKTVNVSSRKSQELYLSHVINYYNYDSYKLTNVKRLKRVVRFSVNKFLGLFRKDIEGFDIFHSSQWFVLNHKTVMFCINEFHRDSRIIKILKYSFAPDEYFFPTIINYCGLLESIQVMDTDEIGTHLKANVHLIDESLSKYFNLDDIEPIMSSDKLFVRKVNSVNSSALMNSLDDYILMNN